jgi:outer membrane autotransporter protein
MDQSSELGVFSTLVYGNIPLLDDQTNFLYQFGYAWQKNDSNRYISLVGSTANADYTTNTASVDLKLVRDYSVSKKLLLQPMVGVTYRNFTSPDNTETGAGSLNLHSDKFSTDELIVGVGALAHLKLDRDSKLIANVNVGYDTYDNQQIITSSYEGASGVLFDTNGIDNGRWNYDLGLGYERDVAEGHNINFSYNYQGQGTTFENHVLSAKYVFSF